MPDRSVVPVVTAFAWRDARVAAAAAINGARAEAGLPPLSYDAQLERVGDAFCTMAAEEGGTAHFARDGVPPYLRYLLAGGRGYHRQNVASYDSTMPVRPEDVPSIVAKAVRDMLAEQPPDDGHRRTILDPHATRLGVGVAARGGRVRSSHEVATDVALAWSTPPPTARPLTVVQLKGRMATPWRVQAVEVAWAPLPKSWRAEDVRAGGSYSYPPQRALYSQQGGAIADTIHPRGTVESLRVDILGNLSFTWRTGPAEGIEIAVLWARSSARETKLVPVGTCAVVVTSDGNLPPALAFWKSLRLVP